MASVKIGWANIRPPGNGRVGTRAITSKRADCPAMVSAMISPAKVAKATPWPE